MAARVSSVTSQRYKYSSSGTFTAVHIQLRYISTANAAGGTFIFGARLSVGVVHLLFISAYFSLLRSRGFANKKIKFVHMFVQ